MLKVILTLAILGLAIYLIVRLVQGRGDAGQAARPRAPKPGPVAPDDDPGFLRDLDDQLWRERKDKPGTDGAAGTPQ
ncbi:MAG TPA: hypothetical protein VMT88_07820 [Actinomycetes bacterium]|nr:hypothetical protein [Actinomycetes bacterium]